MGKNLNLRPNLIYGLIFAFLVNTFGPLPLVQAQLAPPEGGEFRLPAPGLMVHLSPEFNPPILKGIKVHPDNPFRFDFILDQGDSVIAIPSSGVIAIPEGAKQSQQEQLKTESTRLIKYFLASLTIPEKDLWVNLSPYEKDRIIPQSFGLTEMGRDLLAEDYMLKQITASLIYPEDEIGKKFWKRVYEEASLRYGTTNIPVNTFNKVWIVPEKAVVYENAKAGTAYVVESKLKVMLEQDYLALEKNNSLPLVGSPPRRSFGETGVREGDKGDVNSLGSQIVREVVIPELTKEVNEDKNFAQLRQVYNSLILATWYKKKIKDSILEQVYADKNKVVGVGYEKLLSSPNGNSLSSPNGNSLSSPNALIGDPEYIYQQYLKAFKKGVYNFIKEEQDPMTQQTIPRKYFSGGVEFKWKTDGAMEITHDSALIADDNRRLINEKVDLAMSGPGGRGQSDLRFMLQYFINWLIETHDPNLFNDLESRINSGNPREGAMTIEILSERPDRFRFLKIFLMGVKSKYRFVRLAAVKAAQMVNDGRANEILLTAVKDPDTRIAMEALDILEKSGQEEDIPELLSIEGNLQDEEIFYIYDDHSTMVAYTRPVEEGKNATTMLLKLTETKKLEDFVKIRIREVISSIKERSIEMRRSKKIVISNVEDQLFRDFMKWLKENGFGDIVVFGGGVRDALIGRNSSDFDITVAVPLTDEEYFQFLSTRAQANKRIILYVRERLRALAEKLNVPLEDFFDPTKLVLWHGREIQYSGPIEKRDIEGRPVYIKRALVDSNSLGLFSSSSGPSILQMAVDVNGQLYGQVGSIEDFYQNMIRIIGSINDMNIGMVMRTVRLQCELGLKLTDADDQSLRGLIRNYIAKRLYEQDPYLKEVVVKKQLNSIAKIVKEHRSKIDPVARLQELGMVELIQDHLGIKLSDYFDSAMLAGNRAMASRGIDEVVRSWAQGSNDEIFLTASDGAIFQFKHQMKKAQITEHQIDAFLDGRKIGYVHFSVNPNGPVIAWMETGFPQYNHTDKYNGYSSAIFVEPEISNSSLGNYRGVGRSLLGLAERLALNEGAGKFYVNGVSKANFYNFYQNLGYGEEEFGLQETATKKLDANTFSKVEITNQAQSAPEKDRAMSPIRHAIPDKAMMPKPSEIYTRTGSMTLRELDSVDARLALRKSLLSGIEMKWKGGLRNIPKSVAAFNRLRVSKLYQEGIERIKGYGSIERFVEKTTLDHPISYIFEEILTNACDAYAQVGKQGPILFRVNGTEDNYVIEVLDNGWGYFPEAQNLPMPTQIPSKYFKKEGGRGIGVEWSTILAQAYGGDLEFFKPTDAGYVTGVRVTLPKTSVSLKVDKAMLQVESIHHTGGIDLTPANMNLQTQNIGAGIKFYLDSAQLAQLQNAPGFVPVIINIQPMTDLRQFLGLSQEKVSNVPT